MSNLPSDDPFLPEFEIDVNNWNLRVDDIGLETFGGTTVLETTCEESPLQEKSLDPKVAPRFADRDLQMLIDAWSRLSNSNRQKILQIVRDVD